MLRKIWFGRGRGGAGGGGAHNPGTITRLASFGVGVKKYGEFQPKGDIELAAVGGAFTFGGADAALFIPGDGSGEPVGLLLLITKP